MQELILKLLVFLERIYGGIVITLKLFNIHLMARFPLLFLLLSVVQSCDFITNSNTEDKTTVAVVADTVAPAINEEPERIIAPQPLNKEINSITPKELVTYAKTLVGIPYLYASTNPTQGFDCSGFITYVFNHFQIAVPRSSVDFTNVGKPIDVQAAKEGDLVLFTGTVDSIRIVGHMGIVTENVDTLKFIHSTSGKANGVTITPLNEYYKKRFVKVIRVFAEP